MAGAIEIVVCLQRERYYFHSRHNVTIDQWCHFDFREKL